ncbi:MAG: Do family serine endopeptidase [Saprospiraceae bacterium]|nr:Do family serine endopeptidase [Saprospiraceae bacterium]
MNSLNFKSIISSALGMILIIGIYHFSFNNQNNTLKIEHISSSKGKNAVMTIDNDGELKPLSFTNTAEDVLKAVVHIKSTQIGNISNSRQQVSPRNLPDPFRDFFGDQFFRFESPRQMPNSPRIGTGSGVIINEKGYIVTNNHVIDNADDLEVTLHDNRTFKATVVGADPTTDLALIQIKAKDLPTVAMMNSEDIKIGEWVLAVGNPMGLNSTVTAGIVSAKGRNINILKEKFAVESFIQTDAAINPGNSGGALVNLDGGLIGINTAIASPTGSYSGYGFAVPSNIVNKVVEDLLTYGVVQRGVLGVMIRSVDGNLAKEKDLSQMEGAYVDSLLENSAAAASGILVGDVITKVEGKKIKSSPDLQAIIAQYRPGDNITIGINREGKQMDIKVTLINTDGNKSLIEKDSKKVLAILGAEFKTIENKLAKKMDIEGGVEVTKLFAGKLRKHTQIREGFIITKVDGQDVKSKEELIKILESKKGGVMLEGIYKDIPGEYYYAFGL